MRTNLRFIARAIDWPSDVLPTPGGPTKHRIGPLIRARRRRVRVFSFCTARYSTIRSFDLVEIVVVLVEDLARRDRIQPIRRRHRPGHVEHPVDVGADHLVLGRGRRHPLEAVDFAAGDGGDVVRQLRVGEPLADLLRFRLLALAELVLNRLELLAQVVLPLRVGHLLLRRRLDLALQLEQRDFPRQRVGDRLQLGDRIVGFENPLLLVGLDVEQARQHIRQAQRIVDAHHQAAQLLRDRPLDSDSARSISSWMRRTYASTSIERSVCSGNGETVARSELSERITASAFARTCLRRRPG